MSRIRDVLKTMILLEAEERGMILTAEELRNATNGVEYWFDESVYDSIDTAVSDVGYDRERAEPFVTVKFFMNGDESGQLHEKSFPNEFEYAEWLDDTQKSIEMFDEKFI